MLPPDGGDMTHEAVRDLRIALCDSGYQFIPEVTGGKFPPRPYSNWRELPPFDPSQRYQSPFGDLLNTALRLNGVAAIDGDIDDADDMAEVMDILCDQLGPSPCMRSRSNSPRRAMLYRCDDPQGFSDTWKGTWGAIEIFAGPLTKLTAFGWHVSKETGVWRRIEWHEVPGNVRRDELPLVTRAQLTRAMTAAQPVLGEKVGEWHRIPSTSHEIDPNIIAADLNEVVRAMLFIPNEGPVDWNAWNYWGMACYGATGGHDQGLRAWLQWCAKNPETRRRDCLARWLAYAASPPQRIGAPTIFATAYKHGYRKPPAQAAAETLKWAKRQQQKRRLANLKHL
jgi:hypothetical protein